MNKNRPTARKVTHSGSGSGVHKTGGGRGGSSVGGGGFFGGGSGGSHSSGGGSHSSSSSSHSSGSSGSHYSGSGGTGRTRAGGKPGIFAILAVVAAMLFGGGGLAINGMSGDTDYQQNIQSGNGSYNGWYTSDASSGNTGVLNTSVSSDARDRFTRIKGDGSDTNTIMVYMCGTDLESRSAMGTSDLNEMISATVGRNINLIVYTGGCKRWRNSSISSSHNQVWQIQNGSIKRLIDNAGNDSMTKPATLSSFIRWTAKNFPANRMSLIFWDHGGGSISGYGYDEKYPSSGSMTLSGIDAALKDGGIKYDFIGFDACLMATTETALVVGKYADYLIGSEETEPGIGWYYTNWLTSLSDNPSMETLQIGKQIADDFTKACARKCPGQSTTLSVVDLAELTQTLPTKLNAFADDAAGKISGGEYQQVANARSQSKEFARSNGIDQIDLIHFARLLDTSASKSLAKTLTEAVKYNRTSDNTANAYGLSIYFPYKKLGKVDAMTNTYKKIGMDDDYTACIRQFAQMQTAGQAVGGGNVNPFDLLTGGGSGSSDLFGTGGSSDVTSQAIQQLIGSLLGGRSVDFDALGIEGLDESNTEFLRQDPLDSAQVAEYVSENHITEDDLAWQERGDGSLMISLTDEQWDCIESVDKNMYYDDGEGYIDLGLDNIFEFDDDGNLLPDEHLDWLSIEKQPVAYYHTDTVDYPDGTYSISGYVPVELNGKDAQLILTFDSANEDGYIAGVRYDYDEDVTETQAKNLVSLEAGDQVKFLCDFYSYKGRYEDNYQLGRTWTVKDPENVSITNTDVGDGDVMILSKFTDMYGHELWTKPLR